MKSNKKVSSYLLKRLGYTSEEIKAISQEKRVEIVKTYGDKINTSRRNNNNLKRTIELWSLTKE